MSNKDFYPNKRKEMGTKQIKLHMFTFNTNEHIQENKV